MTLSTAPLPELWQQMTQKAKKTEAIMPLSMVCPGASADLVAIQGGHALQKRLADLGLTPGIRVRMVQGDGAGPMILAFKDDARLALGRGVAQKILVAIPGNHQEHKA